MVKRLKIMLLLIRQFRLAQVQRFQAVRSHQVRAQVQRFQAVRSHQVRAQAQ